MARMDQLSEGGGLYTGPCEITGAVFGRKSFGKGKKGRPPASLILTIAHPNEANDDKVEDDEYPKILALNGFNKSGWVPSTDGKEEAPEGDQIAFAGKKEDEKITASSAFGYFLKSLRDAGFKFKGDIDASELVGLKIDLDRATLENKAAKGKPDAKDTYERWYVKEILDELPWESEGADEDDDKKKSKKKKPAEAEEVEEADDDEDDDAEESDDDEDAEESDDDGDDEDEADDEEESDGTDKETCLKVIKAVLAANKKGLKVTALASATYPVIQKQFKELNGNRKKIADACVKLVKAGGKNKTFKFDADSGLVKAA